MQGYQDIKAHLSNSSFEYINLPVLFLQGNSINPSNTGFGSMGSIQRAEEKAATCPNCNWAAHVVNFSYV